MTLKMPNAASHSAAISLLLWRSLAAGGDAKPISLRQKERELPSGKFFVFAGAVKSGYIWLAVIGVLNSAVSLFYYLRIMVYMYFKDPTEDFAWVKLYPGTLLAIALAVVGVFYLGVIPDQVMQWAKLTLF